MEAMTDGELVMVFTIFRHGARAPLSLMANDPNKNVWPDGLGSLTNEGKRQAYELGKAYRQQYDGFLSPEYKSQELYVYSTDMDRTIMTAQCCLASMYSPAGEQLWNANLPWQPIPVHTNSAENDPHHLDPATTLFKDLPSDITKPRHIEIYENITIKHKDEWDRWMNYCNPDNPTIQAVACAFDALVIEMKAGLPYVVPPNLNFRLGGTLVLEVLDLLIDTLPKYVENGRALLKDVLTAIESHIDGTKKTKMYMYSMHDLNILSATRLLNLLQIQRTGFCGHCTFELYKDRASAAYYVKLLYRLKYDDKLVEVPLIDNLPYISLDAFQQLVQASQQGVKSTL